MYLGVNGGSGTFAGSIQDGGAQLSLVKQGAGVQVLSDSNTYSGGTTISNGALQLGDGVSNNGYIQGNVANNSALVFANPLPQTFSGQITGNGSVTMSGPGILTVTGSNSYIGGTTVDGGILSIEADSNLGTAPSPAAPNIHLNGGTLQTNGSFAINATRGIYLGMGSPAIDVTAGSSVTYGGVLADAGGSGSLTKTDAGMLALSGSNTYSGGTTLSGGVLQITTSANLGTGGLRCRRQWQPHSISNQYRAPRPPTPTRGQSRWGPAARCCRTIPTGPRSPG